MANVAVASSPPAPSSTHASLFSLLQPIRTHLHPFLGDTDAARLMQTSRSAALLLVGYGFQKRVFAPHSIDELKRAVAFYDSYGLRILRMIGGSAFNRKSLLDHSTGLPLLPASLLALSLGWHTHAASSDNPPRSGSAARAAFDGNDEDGLSEAAREERATQHCSGYYRSMVPVDELSAWDVHRYAACRGLFNRPISESALPSGLRFLQLNDGFNQLILQGTLPDTLVRLQFGSDFNQSLAVGCLPASLRHLVLSQAYNHPLPPGVLPSGLRRLHLGYAFNQRLMVGALPPQLEQLSLGWHYNCPLDAGVIPPSVTHLRLSECFDKPLSVGSIPHGVRLLNLGYDYSHPLSPGVLPATLRKLSISKRFESALEPGSLPDGLQVLSFHQRSAWPCALQPGVIPASIVVISMGRACREELVAGGVPSTVRWLRLPACYDHAGLNDHVSSSTRVVWWDEEDARIQPIYP